MANNEIRVPKQKRSIEKKNGIIKAGYDLFCEKGFYKTNTAEVAKAAGVSTGIVYNYFSDKNDILIEVVKLYISHLKDRFSVIVESPIHKENIGSIIEQFIDVSISSHTMTIEAHNEFLALSMLERDIQEVFSQFENTTLETIRDKLLSAGFSNVDLLVKLKMSYGIVEHLCHEYIRCNSTDEELSKVKALAVSIITGLFKHT